MSLHRQTGESKMKLTPVGIDIAKHVVQVCYVDEETGEIVNKPVKRAAFLEHFANRSPCLIGMEAAVGDRAVLPEGRAWPAADWPGTDAADLLPAAVVRVVSSGWFSTRLHKILMSALGACSRLMPPSSSGCNALSQVSKSISISDCHPRPTARARTERRAWLLLRTALSWGTSARRRRRWTTP